MAANQRKNTVVGNDGLLDSTNLLLLAKLQDNARRSLAELGREIGLSAPAVAERVKRLESEGVIRGYHADVDPRRLGYTLGVAVRVRPAPRQLAAVAALARDTPEVIECHRVTGDDCYLLTAWVRDVEHLERVIDAFAAYGQTTTSIMQSAPVPRRGIVADAGGE
ncbi:MAG TPA: Lrp/AsnC family transcriptional regulator [Solirubrobacteraceae bacterium]|nr:Lrp/AsnC family transcriptional regulator [Solirubrobacteraceae bacterium]